MRRLAASLLLLVALATLAAGWTLDRLYADAQASAEPLAEWRRLGRSLADVLVGGSAGALPADAALLGRGALPLDQDPGGTLQAALEGPIGLALESDAGVTVHYALDADRVLALRYRPVERAPIAPRLFATLGFYLALLLLVLIGLLPLFRRLRRLVRATADFGRGDLSTRVPTATRSELHPLEHGFNRMAGRIERLIEDNRLLGQGVAHDLRTPLARLRFGVDALAERLAPTPTEAIDRNLARLQRDLGAMERQLEALLDYARLESRAGADVRVTLALDRIVAESVDLATVAIDWHQPRDPVRVIGHEAQLRMLIDNLLQNAQRYGRGAVRVRLLDAAHEIVLRVDDDGPGMDPDDRARLLRPFERGHRPHPDDIPDSGPGAAAAPVASLGHGHGLGLALVDRIAAGHGGELRIGDSAALGGARFEVVLPPMSEGVA